MIQKRKKMEKQIKLRSCKFLHIRLNGLTLQPIPSGVAICRNLNCDWKAKKRSRHRYFEKTSEKQNKALIYGAMWVWESVACREGFRTLQRPSQGRLPLIECAIPSMTLKLFIFHMEIKFLFIKEKK